MKLEELSVQEMKQGYVYKQEVEQFQCIHCGSIYQTGEIYPFHNRFFNADKAILLHVNKEHPTHIQSIIDDDSRYNALTDNQKQLLSYYAQGKDDNDIAKLMKISASTVRHQKFMFREKAKQAKLYLAQFESVFEHKDMHMMEIHNHARMVDDRFVISDDEKNRVLELNFDSLEPLRLKRFPVKEKKKIVILTKIAEQFVQNKHYSEKEINEILVAIFHDYVTLRRYLIEYGFLDRSTDGSDYWLK